MAYCDRCERSFPHDRAHEQHRSYSSVHWLCDSCNIDFAGEECLIQHYGSSPKHHYCKECDLDFDSTMSKMQHMEAKHWYCETHDRVHNPVVLNRRHEFDDDDDDDGWWVHFGGSAYHACAPPGKQRFRAKKQVEQHDRDVHRVHQQARATVVRSSLRPNWRNTPGLGRCVSWTGLSCARTARTA
ncbi:hypothetical protein EDB86DRAFT_2959571 [Lactarius hatsudake]|nr:hypothetical protein EDB86DRAFT_2959571 [Lactarius hatsudake]